MSSLADNATSSFVEFPDRRAVFAKLRNIEVYQSSLEPLFSLSADRLEGRAYDRSAFVFILLELIYEVEQDAVSIGDLLGRMVYALTDDLELVGEALDAFEEIRTTIEPSAAAAEAEAMPVAADEVGDDDVTFAGDPGHEYLMLELQLAQKRVMDFGLGTRVSIEMALARPSRDNVRHTLREISALRTGLLRFEELLRESEERILEAIGVLE